jgi:hypothetical protein
MSMQAALSPPPAQLAVQLLHVPLVQVEEPRLR